jgi:tRNA threonylcarbamoyladenosine biosynthesis protein TsaE
MGNVVNEERFSIMTESDQETIRLGKNLGSLLREGDVVALVGELGSGKTWMTKGIASGLGIDPRTVVTSPSFSIVNEYPGRVTLFHVDVYRLEKFSEVLSAGLEEYLHSGGVVVLEWANRWPEILPEWTITAELQILDAERRKITLTSKHPRGAEVIREIKSNYPGTAVRPVAATGVMSDG